MSSSPTREDHHQFNDQGRKHGILWKRRDVFRNKWRPRFFVLEQGQDFLTYYLLSRTADSSTAPATISTPLRRSNNNNNQRINGTVSAPPSLHGPTTNSNSSFPSATENNDNADVSDDEDPVVDYNVVPRGVIYLAGCTVKVNDRLSLPQEGLFAFSIVPPTSQRATEFHLAAKTDVARAAWVASLSAACNAVVRENGGSSSAQQQQQQRIGLERMTTTTTSLPRQSLWKSLSTQEKLFDNVPEPLAARLEQSLESYLELCEDAAPTLNWTPIFQDRAGVSSFQRQDLHGRTMMKSTAVIPHHPKQLLNLLLDPARRKEYETNIAVSERLEVLCDHTFLDYYSFRSVWPTSPRDFAVCLHWQTLRRQLADGNIDEALVILAFSCPDAENLKEPTAPHIRASLHVSFYLLRLIPPPATAGSSDEEEEDEAPPPTASAGDGAKCHMTRILSYDLGGSLPRNLATTVLMQQAGLPGILSKYLKRVEPTPEPRLSSSEDGFLDNENVIDDVVDNIIQNCQSALVSSARRRLNFENNNNNNNKSKQEKESSLADLSSGENNPSKPTKEKPKETSTLKIAVVLLLPILLHRLARSTSLSIISEAFDLWFLHPSFIFTVAAFVASRFAVLSLLGEKLSNSTTLQSYQGGPITLSINVDLKGVLRFIGMKKEEKKELAASIPDNQSTRADVSVVHIIAIAVARAMQNHADCWNYRRVSLPLLFVDSFFRYPNSRLDLSLSLAPGRLVCLEDFAFDKITSVAHAVQAAEQRQKRTGSLTIEIISRFCSIMDFGNRHGHCLIVLTTTVSQDDHQASQNSDMGVVDITTANLPDGMDVLVTVGGVRLQRSNAAIGSPLRAPPPKPRLVLSLTINTGSVLDTATCHAFAEDLAKLIQFPELCED